MRTVLLLLLALSATGDKGVTKHHSDAKSTESITCSSATQTEFNSAGDHVPLVMDIPPGATLIKTDYWAAIVHPTNPPWENCTSSLTTACQSFIHTAQVDQPFPEGGRHFVDEVAANAAFGHTVAFSVPVKIRLIRTYTMPGPTCKAQMTLDLARASGLMERYILVPDQPGLNILDYSAYAESHHGDPWIFCGHLPGIPQTVIRTSLCSNQTNVWANLAGPRPQDDTRSAVGSFVQCGADDFHSPTQITHYTDPASCRVILEYETAATRALIAQKPKKKAS
jgi:hypothetical protein